MSGVARRRSHVLRTTTALTLVLVAACSESRAGNVSVCDGPPRCVGTEASDVVLNQYGSNDCRATVAAHSCGIDAEAVRACANALETAVCKPPDDYSWDAAAALSAAGCAAQVAVLIRCHDENLGSSDDDDDLFDD